MFYVASSGEPTPASASLSSSMRASPLRLRSDKHAAVFRWRSIRSTGTPAPPRSATSARSFPTAEATYNATPERATFGNSVRALQVRVVLPIWWGEEPKRYKLWCLYDNVPLRCGVFAAERLPGDGL